MSRAVIYARISEDRSGRSVGVDAQVKDCQALAEARGWEVVETIVDNDRGASSKSRKPRPGYARVRELVTSGEVDALVAYSSSRLTRRPAELEEVIDWHDRHGIRLATATTGRTDVDLGTAQGRMLARIMAAVDAAEAETISERVKRRAQDIAEAGRPNGGGSRAFGFERDGVTIRADEADVIREAARRKLDGETYRSIARDLTERGILTSTGKPWQLSSLKKVLTAPRVAGLREHNGKTYPAAWQPILDRETWDALVGLPSGPSMAPRERQHTWTGLVRCGLCTAALHVTQVRGKLRYACYPADRGGCGRIVVAKDELDDMLDEVLFQRVEQVTLEAATKDDRVAELDRQVTELEARLHALAESFADGGDLDEYRLAANAVRTRRDEARAELDRARRRAEITRLDPAAVRRDWAALSPAERRDLAGTFVDRVDVGPGRRGLNRFDPDRVSLEWR